MRTNRVKRAPFVSNQVAVIKGMRARGDSQSDIATWFSVNQGRVNEVLVMHEKRWANVLPAPPYDLPPPGPYIVVSEAAYQTIADAASVPLGLLRAIDEKLNRILERDHERAHCEAATSTDFRLLAAVGGDGGDAALASGCAVRTDASAVH